MTRTYVDMIGEYYDNLDAVIDIRASGMGSFADFAEVSRFIHANAVN